MKLILNGEWEVEFPDGRKITVEIPGCWDTYIEEKDIAGKVRFTKRFEIGELVGSKARLPYDKMSQLDSASVLEHGRLSFGAVSYYCDIYLNGQKLKSHEGMWDSFHVDVGTAILSGSNELILDIWKPGYHSGDRFPLREVLSGFLPDVLCTFGGIWGDVCLETAPGCLVDRHWGSGDGQGNIEITVVADMPPQMNSLRLSGEILDSDNNCVALFSENVECTGRVCIRTKVESPRLWELKDPVLYRYRMIVDDGVTRQEIGKKFGFRDIKTKGTDILLNGSPIYARGILHWGYYDKIVPTPEDPVVYEEIQKIKEFGFNMIKHCLYIPGGNYLRLADEMGMLLWIELPLWLPDKTPELEARIKREFPALMEQIAGHPSVVAVSLGCELDDKVDSKVLEEMYLLAKEKLHVLVRDNSGSGECYGGLSVDFADFSDYHFYADLQNMENLVETFTPVWKQNRPWVFGEFCDSDTLRDMEVLRKEKGVEYFEWEKQDEVRNPVSILKPDFFLGSHDERMVQSGIRKEYPLLKKLSYNHSMVHRKTTLEQVRAFPEISGYNITSIRDVPIATSGIFDDCMREKFEAQAFRAFNQDIMLVPAWDLTRVWINADRAMSKERYGFFGGEPYGLHFLVSNYSREELKNPVVTYDLLNAGGKAVLSGRMQGEAVGAGGVKETCYLYLELPKVQSPENYQLSVTLQASGIEIQNEWPVFLYPYPVEDISPVGLFDPMHVFETVENIYPNVEKTDGRNHLNQYPILFCSMLTPEIISYAKNGGAVFYVQRGEGELPVSKVAFWREGIIRKCEHPLMDEIKYDNWMDDLRYFGSATDTAFAEAEDSRFDYRRPILRRYDCREWRADDYLMELGCGKGRIIATTLRIEGGMGKQPLFLQNNRFGRWLLQKAASMLFTGETDE